MEMGTLTAPLLKEPIDHIDVYETEGTGKNRSRRIVIYDRFMGYIELPDTALHGDGNYKAAPARAQRRSISLSLHKRNRRYQTRG